MRLCIFKYIIICLLVVCLPSSLSLASSGSGGTGTLYAAGIQALVYGQVEISYQYGAGHESNATIRSNGWAYYLSHPTDCSGMVQVSLALQGFNPPNWSTSAIYNDTSGQYNNISTGSLQVGDVAVWQGHMGMVVAVNGDGTVDIAHNENVSVNHAHVETRIDPDGDSRWGTGGDKGTKYKRYSGG